MRISGVLSTLHGARHLRTLGAHGNSSWAPPLKNGNEGERIVALTGDGHAPIPILLPLIVGTVDSNNPVFQQ